LLKLYGTLNIKPRITNNRNHKTPSQAWPEEVWLSQFECG